MTRPALPCSMPWKLGEPSLPCIRNGRGAYAPLIHRLVVIASPGVSFSGHYTVCATFGQVQRLHQPYSSSRPLLAGDDIASAERSYSCRVMHYSDIPCHGKSRTSTCKGILPLHACNPVGAYEYPKIPTLVYTGCCDPLPVFRYREQLA